MNWHPFATAPKTGEDILIYGRWKTFLPLEVGEPCVIIARWGKVFNTSTVEWVTDFNYVRNWNVEWLMWCKIELPEDGLRTS